MRITHVDTNEIDYKNPKLLRRFLTETGKIMPGRITGLKPSQQRKLAKEIKKGREMGLLPYGG